MMLALIALHWTALNSSFLCPSVIRGRKTICWLKVLSFSLSSLFSLNHFPAASWKTIVLVQVSSHHPTSETNYAYVILLSLNHWLEWNSWLIYPNFSKHLPITGARYLPIPFLAPYGLYPKPEKHICLIIWCSFSVLCIVGLWKGTWGF